MPDRDPSSADLADTELLKISVSETGEIARRYFRGNYAAWDKGKGNPVTEADIAIDRALRETLMAARPDYGWLSEESEDDPARLARARTFVVDPIDGTVGFLKGRPQFTIVATVVTEGRPVSAAIYNPITEELYDATYRGGAHLNGEAIRVSGHGTLEQARILAPRTYFDPAHWKTPWPESLQVESRSSIAYRFALVAEGRYDALISLSAKHDWDLAAGDLILNEAGGRVTSPEGTILTYNHAQLLQRGVLGAGPGLHDALSEKLNEATA